MANHLNIDCIIPPGHSAAAAILLRDFARDRYLPHIVVMARKPDSVPPRFVPIELVRGGKLLAPAQIYNELTGG